MWTPAMRLRPVAVMTKQLIVRRVLLSFQSNIDRRFVCAPICIAVPIHVINTQKPALSLAAAPAERAIRINRFVPESQTMPLVMFSTLRLEHGIAPYTFF